MPVKTNACKAENEAFFIISENIVEYNTECLYVVLPKSSRNLNAARKPLVVQLWASRYRELYPL
jgi:hypothetical protein